MRLHPSTSFLFPFLSSFPHPIQLIAFPRNHPQTRQTPPSLRDNHPLRARAALTSLYYHRIMSGEALRIMETCEQLVAGGGGRESDKGMEGLDGVGNAPLRL